MNRVPSDDPVLTSVAAYSGDPTSYQKKYATHLLDRPARFASLLAPKSRILDLGCGPGRDLQIFTEAGHTAIGMDLNPDFIAMARQHGDVVEADIRDVLTYFSPLSFEGVWAQASLVHLPHDDIEKLLHDVKQLLKPNGYFYSCVPAVGDTGWLDEEDGCRWYSTWPNDSFQDAVASAGFHVFDVIKGHYVEVWAQAI